MLQFCNGDIAIIIGDWYTRNHTALMASLDARKELGMPDGVPDGIQYETVNFEPAFSKFSSYIIKQTLNNRVGMVTFLERFPQAKRINYGTPDQTEKQQLQYVKCVVAKRKRKWKLFKRAIQVLQLPQMTL